MRQLWAPGCLVLLQAILLAGALAATGRFDANVVPDTPGYIEFPLDSVAAALEHPRTFGYPMFLRCVAVVRPAPEGVPAAQFTIHVVCVLLFWLGLRSIVSSPWTSMVLASSLLYSNVVLRYTDSIAPDSLASSLSIASIGLLLLLLRDPRSARRWCALAMAIFLTYQSRPAYLFLVPLIPVLGVTLFWMQAVRQSEAPRLVRRFLQLLMTSAVPLLVFCAAKWIVVGNFSLVSFGGNNFAGVVTRFLDEETAASLPAEVRPLADEVLRQRQLAAERHDDFADGTTRSYFQIENGFDIETWEVCVPAAEEVHGDDWKRQNKGLAELSKSIVRARPIDYAIWLLKAFVRGVYMITSEIVANPIYFLLLAALILLHARYVYHRCLTPGALGVGDNTYFFEINALWAIAISFALLKIVAVIVTTPPLGRFMDAAGVFFAPVITCAIVHKLRPKLTTARFLGR